MITFWKVWQQEQVLYEVTLTVLREEDVGGFVSCNPASPFPARLFGKYNGARHLKKREKIKGK